MTYPLGFPVCLFSCPVDERWEVMSHPEERRRGITGSAGDGPAWELGRGLDGARLQA